MIQYCEHEPPRILYTYDNWTHMPTSADQLRIEDALENMANPKQVWLHIGIGNSSLAKRFAWRVKRIDGITVAQEEIDTAPNIQNYIVSFCDKHSQRFLKQWKYDVIIDTTPCGHACCKKHLNDYFDYVFAMLAPDGIYLTDRAGLAWAQPTSKGMTPSEFTHAISRLNVKVKFITEFVMEVSQ